MCCTRTLAHICMAPSSCSLRPRRFFVGSRGGPAFEALQGRKFRAQMLAFGESCIFFKPTKYKGDLQWKRGIWVGLSEKNGAHVLLTPEGAVESRSVRRRTSGIAMEWCQPVVCLGTLGSQSESDRSTRVVRRCSLIQPPCRSWPKQLVELQLSQ